MAATQQRRHWSTEAFTLLDIPQRPSEYWRVRTWNARTDRVFAQEKEEVTETVWAGLHPEDRRRIESACGYCGSTEGTYDPGPGSYELCVGCNGC
jgi:hypothetical protein